MTKESSATRRFYAEDLSGQTVQLSPTEAHHATDVLRVPVGAEVELFDGSGGVAVGQLEPTGGAATVRIAQRRATARPEPIIELAVATPKGKRLDWMLEKVTELGAAKLTPVVFERGVAAPKLTKHADRWRAICIAAAKQCGASFLPEIASPVKLAALLASRLRGVRILAEVEADAALRALLAKWSPGEPMVIVIGPEGGLTDAERRAAVEAGFVPARLGELVLRVETAAVALLAGVNVLCRM